MNHDNQAENWSRGANRYCKCPPVRYSPRAPKPTEPDCPLQWDSTGMTENRKSTTTR